MRYLVQGCWFCYKWALALAAVAVVAIGLHWYLHLDRTIQGRILKLLNKHYPQLESRIAGIRVIPDQGILIVGLTIHGAGQPPTAPALLQADEILLVCRPQLDQLLSGNLTVDRVICRRPTLRATRNATGSWDVAQLWPPPRLSDRRPAQVVEQGRIEINCDGEWYRCEEVGLAIDPPQGGRQNVAGQLRGGQVGSCNFSGWWDSSQGTYSVQGKAADLKVAPALWRCCAEAAPASALLPASFEGRLGGAFRVEQFATQEPRRAVVALDVSLDRGKILDPRLPEPLEQITARFRVDRDTLTLVTAKASSRAAQWTASGSMALAAVPPRANWRIAARQLQLPETPPKLLSQEWQQKYTAWQPSGLVDLQLQLEARAGTWHPTLTAECQGVDFRSPRFPYQVQAATGTVHWAPDRWDCRLTARAGRRPITIHAESQARRGFLRVTGQDLRIEPDLIAALPPQTAKVVSDLHPTGTMDVEWQTEFDASAADRPRNQLELAVRDGTLRYAHFPLDIQGVRGKVRMQHGNWDLLDFQGQHGTAVVTCEGVIRPATPGSQLALQITAHQVSLNRELRATLRPEAQRIWDEVRPRGRVNLVTNVTHRTGDAAPRLTIGLQPVPGTTSIELRAFPYRWENIQGSFTFQEGIVSFDGMRAAHGNVLLRAGGQSSLSSAGWRLAIRDLHVDNLVPARDRELLLALPTGLRRAVTRLALQGSVHLAGGLDFSRGPSPAAPLQSAWDLHVTLHGNSVQLGIPLTNLHGEVQLLGNFDGEQVVTRGNLDLDSLQYGNLQWTGLTGPFWYDGKRVLLGKWADPQATTRLTGQCYGGKVALDGWITEETIPQFQLRVDLANSDLNRLASEGLGIQDRVQGRLYSSLQLAGDARGRHTLRGNGRLQLRNADIGELTAMVRLLKVLSAKEPDATAFTASNVDFQIRGEHVLVQQLELLGDAVSLYGQGEIGFDLQSRLTFRSLIGRSQLRIPLLRDLVNEASQQILQIYVTGPIHRPEVESKVLPLVSGALQQLEVDLQTPRAPSPNLTVSEPSPAVPLRQGR